MDLTLLADLWDFLSVDRHVPGKLSLKVDLAIRNHPRAAGLSRSEASTVSAIRKIRLNIFTRTLTVEYDTDKLSFELLQRLLSSQDRAQMRSLAEQFSLA